MKARTVVSLICLGLTQTAWAQDTKPNFTGRWEVKSVEADKTIITPPPPLFMEVEHQEPRLVVDHQTYRTDGKEEVIVYQNTRIKRKAEWQSNRLIVSTQINRGKEMLYTEETWQLSETGDRLMITRELTGQIKTKVILTYDRVKQARALRRKGV